MTGRWKEVGGDKNSNHLGHYWLVYLFIFLQIILVLISSLLDI